LQHYLPAIILYAIEAAGAVIGKVVQAKKLHFIFNLYS
jgi:hypothetical protein